MKTMLIRVLGRATGAGLILAAAAIVLLITLLTAWPNNEAAAQGSVPDKPARPTAETVSHDSVTFSWADPGDSSITGYQVFRRNWSTDDAGAFNVIQDDTGNADTSYTDGSVDPSTRYSYRLKARNANGLSARSGYVRVDTPAAPTTTPTPEPTATPAPTPSREENRGEEQGEQGNSENSEQQGRSHSNQPQNLRATVVTYERIRIDWNQAPSGITHYKIGRSGGGLPGYEEVGQITTWDSNSNLKPDSSYTFTVRLGTSDSHFGPASSITVTTLAIPTPTNLRRTRSGTSGASAVADFEWDNPSDTTNLQQVSAIYDGNMVHLGYDLYYGGTTSVRRNIILSPDTTYYFATWYRTTDESSNNHDGPKAWLRFTTPKLPEVSISDTSVVEGGTLTFTITLHEFVSRRSTVSAHFSQTGSPDITEPEDKDDVAGRVSFNQGTTRRTFTLQTTEDTIYEGDEYFTAVLSLPMGLTIAKGTARGTIIDNDPPPRLSITASTAKEGDQNLGKVEFQLEMEAAAGTDITIDVGAENRTAVLGQDFLAPVTSITIPEGETQATISVEIIDDNVFEGGILESFDLVLSNPEPPIFAGEVRATGYIEDDEPRRQDVDYVGNTVDTTATIDVGMSWFNDNPVQGKVESEYDQDWYKTTLVENHCYQIEVRGKGHVDNGFARGLTLPDPFLRGLYTQYGNYIEGTQNNDGGSYLAALKTVKIDATSVIYISVMGGQEDDRGIFDLSVIDLGTVTETCTDIDPSVTDALQSTETDTPETVAEPVAEDLPENVTTIGYMNPNGLPAHGTIDAASDKDWFKVPLIAGFRYTIEMKGDVSSDYGGTLDDPLLYLRGQFGGQLPHNSLFIRSYNSDETLVVGDRDSGAGSNAKLRVRVNYTDMYFIQARSSNSTQGTYTVVVTRR